MFAIDPFTITMSLGPLGIYFLLIGLINISKRPLVTTGLQDIVALAVATSGLLLTGPLNLFFPSSAYGMLGGKIVWAMLAVFYFLVLLLIILLMRPRLVVYGSSAEDVRSALLRAAQTIDPQSRSEGEQVWMPQLKAGFRVDVFVPTDVPQVLPQTHAISPTLWRRLTAAFRKEMLGVANPLPQRGVPLLIIAALIMLVVISKTYAQPAEVVEGFRRWLRI